MSEVEEKADFDVESQTTGDTSVTSRSGDGGLMRKPVYMNLSDKTIKQFQKLYKINPIVQSKEIIHSHPHLAYSRNTLEAKAVKLIVKEYPNASICDVGSAARRIRRGKESIHCMCPNIQPGDVNRMNAAKKTPNRVCAHRLQDCTCGPFDVLLFVHSAYYFDWKDLSESLQKTTTRTAYVVGHVFPEAYGHFAYDEGSYEVKCGEDGPSICCRVKGNAHEYNHKPLLWDGCYSVGDKCQSLDVMTIAKLGDTHLWKVMLVDRPCVQKSLGSWEEQVVDQEHMGPITIPGHDLISKRSIAANGKLDFVVDNLYGWGPIVYSVTTRGTIFVPRGAIQAAAIKLVFKRRDPASFADTAHAMRSAVSISRLPAEMQLKAVTLGTALAFTMNVQNEADVLQTVTSRFDWLWRMHAGLVSLTPIRVWTLYTIIFWLLIGLILSLIIYFEVPFDSKILGKIALVLWGSSSFLMLLSLWCARKQQVMTGESWTSALYHEGRAVNITGGSVSRLKRRLFPPNNNLREPLLPPDDCVMIVGNDLCLPKHPGKPSDVMRTTGMVFSTTVPSVTVDNQEAEIVALTHRVLRDATYVAPGAYKRYMNWRDYPAGQALMSIRVSNGRRDFEDWVNQPKFNEPTKLKFRELYSKWVGKYPPRSNYRAFVKIEKNKTHTVDGPPKLKPRLIQGPWDGVKVMVGPMIAKLYTAVRRVWDGRDCNVLYGSGITPEVLGERCDAFANSQGGWQNIVAAFSDCICYDSKCQNELIEPVHEWYREAGMDDLTYAWLKSSSSAGVTKHGIVYKPGKKIVTKNNISYVGDKAYAVIDGKVTEVHADEVDVEQIHSGQMDTNLIGTIINVFSNISGLTIHDFLLVVCGDDIIIFANKRIFPLSVVEQLRRHLEALGHEVEMNYSDRRCDWEFCSKLFWEAESSDGKIYTVPGPKPGRLLSRVGLNLTLPGSLNFRGAMIGLEKDVAHIPLLSTYVEIGLKLTEGEKAKGFEWNELKHAQRKHACTDSNYNLIFERYGVSRETITQYEYMMIRDATTLPIVLDFPSLPSMVERDEA
jgi:hypothetical protein